MSLLVLDSSSLPQFNSDDFTVNFNTGIPLDGEYEMALLSANLWYSYFNIDAAFNNNIFTYSHNGGVNWTNIVLPNGSYQISDINDYIQIIMRQNGHWDSANNTYYINLIPNFSTLKLIVQITNASYRVDFTTSLLRNLLGFTSIIVTSTQEGANRVDITRGVNTLVVHCDAV